MALYWNFKYLILYFANLEGAGSIPEKASFYQNLIASHIMNYLVVDVVERQGYHLVIRSKANNIPFINLSLVFVIFVNWEDKASLWSKLYWEDKKLFWFSSDLVGPLHRIGRKTKRANRGRSKIKITSCLPSKVLITKKPCLPS